MTGDGPSEIRQLAVAVSRLSPFTTAPDDCCFCIWEGYENLTNFGVARIAIPERNCYLFRRTADDLLTWEDARDGPGQLPIPAVIWPADRAWCIANDVDPHFAPVGGSAQAIDDLLTEPRIDTVVDDPGVDPPFYC